MGTLLCPRVFTYRFFWKAMLLPLPFLQIWELASGCFLKGLKNRVSSFWPWHVMRVKLHRKESPLSHPVLIWYNVKGWNWICTATERIYGIFVVDIMYKKRYRHCIHTCYYTMTIFYPVSVDVIFIESFDPNWRGWSGSVLFYLQPCSRNNRPAVQMSTYLSVWCMVIYFCCMFIYLIKMGVGKYVTDSSYFNILGQFNFNKSLTKCVHFGPSWCICHNSNWDTGQVKILSLGLHLIVATPLYLLYVIQWQEDLLKFYLCYPKFPQLSFVVMLSFSMIMFEPPRGFLLVIKVRVSQGAKVCFLLFFFCLFLDCYVFLFGIVPNSFLETFLLNLIDWFLNCHVYDQNKDINTIQLILRPF